MICIILGASEVNSSASNTVIQMGSNAQNFSPRHMTIPMTILLSLLLRKVASSHTTVASWSAYPRFSIVIVDGFVMTPASVLVTLELLPSAKPLVRVLMSTPAPNPDVVQTQASDVLHVNSWLSPLHTLTSPNGTRETVDGKQEKHYPFKNHNCVKDDNCEVGTTCKTRNHAPCYIKHFIM